MIDHFRRAALEQAYLAELALVPEAEQPSAEEQYLILEDLREIDRLLGASEARSAFLYSRLDGMPRRSPSVSESRCRACANTWPRACASATSPLRRAPVNADDRHSPVRARVLDEAIAWQLLLDSGEAHPTITAPSTAGTRRIPNTNAPGNSSAASTGTWRAANGPARNALLSGNALKRPPAPARRQRPGAVLALGVGSAWPTAVPVRYLLADAYSATGEQRELTLPDATHVRLNSRSAIDVRFDGERRQVVLLAGEILVKPPMATRAPSWSAAPMATCAPSARARRHAPHRVAVGGGRARKRSRRACDQGRPAGADPARKACRPAKRPRPCRRLGTRHAGGGEPAGRPGGGTGALFAGAAAGRPEHRRPARHRRSAEGHPPRPSGFGAEACAA